MAEVCQDFAVTIGPHATAAGRSYSLEVAEGVLAEL
jgi:hypothetical protein